MEFTYLRSNGQVSKRGTRLVGEYGLGNYWGVYTDFKLPDGTKVKVTAGKKYTTPRHMNWCQVRFGRDFSGFTIISPSIAPEWAKGEVDYLVGCIENKWYWRQWQGEDSEANDYRYPDKQDITPSWANGYRVEMQYSDVPKDGEIVFYDECDEPVIMTWIPKHDTIEDIYKFISEHLYMELEWAGFYWEDAKEYKYVKPSTAYSMSELEQIANENDVKWTITSDLRVNRMNIVRALRKADLLN